MTKTETRKIVIHSGEGDYGDYELYTGKISDHAIKLRLASERAGGDRWATAWEYSHESELGPVYVKMFARDWEARHIDDEDIDGL